jgi:hypothetical protein
MCSLGQIFRRFLRIFHHLGLAAVQPGTKSGAKRCGSREVVQQMAEAVPLPSPSSSPMVSPPAEALSPFPGIPFSDTEIQTSANYTLGPYRAFPYGA